MGEVEQAITSRTTSKMEYKIWIDVNDPSFIHPELRPGAVSGLWIKQISAFASVAVCVP